MNLVNLVCPGCGAIIHEENGKTRCEYCGREILIESKTVEKISETVKDSIDKVGSLTIEEITTAKQTTNNELKRLQATQELSALQMQLSNLRSEKRNLYLINKKNRIHKNQLRQIEDEEKEITNRINSLQSFLFVNSNASNQAKPTINAPMIIKEHPPRSQGVALLLAFFLGFFGVHRFYTGHTKLGIIYLFTMGIFGLGWMYDIFIIAINNYKDANGQKLIPMGSLGKKIALGILITSLVQMVFIAITTDASTWTVLVSIALAVIIVNLRKIVDGILGIINKEKTTKNIN